jgi:7,8-dihydro-6-hydroxymethylpterin-pyrophosphokinase
VCLQLLLEVCEVAKSQFSSITSKKKSERHIDVRIILMQRRCLTSTGDDETNHEVPFVLSNERRFHIGPTKRLVLDGGRFEGCWDFSLDGGMVVHDTSLLH